MCLYSNIFGQRHHAVIDNSNRKFTIFPSSSRVLLKKTLYPKTIDRAVRHCILVCHMSVSVSRVACEVPVCVYNVFSDKK